MGADIVIIGGGVHGASLAFHLARQRAGKVVLLEKHHLASGPTAKSGTLIRPLFVVRAYIQLVLEATEMFENWEEEVGSSPGFVQNGFLRISRSLEPALLGGDLELMKGLGAPFEVLKRGDLSECAYSSKYREEEVGLFFPRGGFADPVLTTLSLARAAEGLGAEVCEGVSVTGFRVEQGRIEAVETNRGPINTRMVVNCAGAWGHRVASLAGLELPIEVHRQPTCLFDRPEELRVGAPILSDGVNRVYMREIGGRLMRSAPFGWLVDPTDPDAYDETIDREQIPLIRKALENRTPTMSRAACYGGFSAVYDMTPDGHPIIGDFPEVEGFWCNCGWSGNGFAGAPALGRHLANLILEGSSKVDLSRFRWPRPEGVQAMVY